MIEHDCARRNRASKAGDKRRPSGQKSREPAEGGVQVNILAARARTQRRQLGIRHRSREGERAARNPGAEKPDGVGNSRRDLRRCEQNAAADDVGNDDGGSIERAEPSLEL